MQRYLVPIGLLLLLFATRSAAIEVLPLHNDEGLHLTRAVEVWNLNPFWEIRDGKVINHWLIALFYPQNAPVFTGRIATVFVAMLGGAAAYRFGRDQVGYWGGVFAITLWTAAPPLLFYERTALSDAEAGAWAMIAWWLANRALRRDRLWLSFASGLAIGIAALFKLTALPFALGLAIFVLLEARLQLRRCLLLLMMMAFAVILCLLPPTLWLALRGQTYEIAFGWLARQGAGSSGIAANLITNPSRLFETFTGYGTLFWAIVLMFTCLIAIWRVPRLCIIWCVPTLAIIALGTDAMPRHFITALPWLLALVGCGMAIALHRLRAKLSGIVVIMLLVAGLIPTAYLTHRSPEMLALPVRDIEQFISGHPSGYGLREAAHYIQTLRVASEVLFIASMFPDSCRRANFYASNHRQLMCINAAESEQHLQSALEEYSLAYVLAEPPPIGLDVATVSQHLNAEATLLQTFPRPRFGAGLQLWLVRSKAFN
ncbi:MAG: hypothetical protein OHK0023_13530 [Anaerolineae bacterium]